MCDLTIDTQRVLYLLKLGFRVLHKDETFKKTTKGKKKNTL